jgi:LEA14-like dessication related protein
MKQWILVIVTTVVLGAACKKLQDFQFLGVQNFRVKTPDYNTATLSADVLCYNPNGYGVKVKHIDAQIFVNGNLAGNYTLDTLMQIPARANFVFPARMEIKNYGAIFSGALSLLTNKEMSLRVVGNVKAGKNVVYINFPFDITSSQKLDFKF